MKNKNCDEQIGQLQLDFYQLRKDISLAFRHVPETIIQTQNPALAFLALDIGKLILWHAPNIDRHSEALNVLFPVKIPSSASIAENIRRASVDFLDGKNVALCNRHVTTGFSGVHERLDKLTALLIGGAK